MDMDKHIISSIVCQPAYICNGLNPANINANNLLKYSSQVNESFNT